MSTYTAFFGPKLLARGPLPQVVAKAKRHADKAGQNGLLVFADDTGKCMDFDLEGTEEAVLRRLEVFIQEPAQSPAAGPGRPRMGVASREVSLLPRHWEWLATQPGGASATLRKLVEEAKRKTTPAGDLKLAQERTYKFMQALAGDLEGYEEALRALYRKDKKSFQAQMRNWPKDIREHAISLSEPVFAP